MWLPRYKLLGKDPRCLTSVPGGGSDGLGFSAGELSITTPYSIAERSIVTYRGRRLSRFTNPPPKPNQRSRLFPDCREGSQVRAPKGPKNKFDTAGAEHGNVLARHDHPHLGRPWIKVVKGGTDDRPRGWDWRKKQRERRNKTAGPSTMKMTAHFTRLAMNSLVIYLASFPTTLESLDGLCGRA
ncbi:hypothetical protein CIHG_04324 [Coccidioides immitis H538.4]|uniref:Uncharacterized protein n=2 Tax=Coccidioides immitis TaxID=5501 RepID=A0A0J8RN54_COCIT|nr:hypothetical protein CIRG_09257 [Coccidioides immitis RMSCC 2394]KMU86535.1 hypothetical protein CIHG_04324 [Coccidioides immitis H538.4]